MGDLTMHSHLPLCQLPVVMGRGNSSKEARKASSCSVMIEYPQELGASRRAGDLSSHQMIRRCLLMASVLLQGH